MLRGKTRPCGGGGERWSGLAGDNGSVLSTGDRDSHREGGTHAKAQRGGMCLALGRMCQKEQQAGARPHAGSAWGVQAQPGGQGADQWEAERRVSGGRPAGHRTSPGGLQTVLQTGTSPRGREPRAAGQHTADLLRPGALSPRGTRTTGAKTGPGAPWQLWQALLERGQRPGQGLGGAVSSGQTGHVSKAEPSEFPGQLDAGLNVKFITEK